MACRWAGAVACPSGELERLYVLPVGRGDGQVGGDFEQLGRRRLPAEAALGKLAGSFIVNAKNQQNEDQAFHARGGRLTRRGRWHPSFGSLSVDGG